MPDYREELLTQLDDCIRIARNIDNKSFDKTELIKKLLELEREIHVI